MEDLKRVLIADDDPVSRLTLKKVLEKLGYEVITASEGLEAIAIAEREDSPQLLFLDWKMPGLDGIEICKRLTTHDPTKRFHYKIILTAQSHQDAIVLALESGADDFIAKPFSIEELIARLSVGKRIVQMYEYSREQTKQLAQADRMVSMGIMAAGVAHEINNPATFISGNIQLLSDMWDTIDEEFEKVPENLRNKKVTIINEEMPQLLKDINHGIERITEIVSGLKSFTRTDSDHRIECSIHDPIEEALKFSRNRLIRGIEIIEEFAEMLPTVHINSVEIEQVIVNLLINAIDAIESVAEKGWIKIETFQTGNFVTLKISDSGPGMPDDIREQLFTPFFTTKEVGKGTGLGLSISQKIIQDHGGNIKVEHPPHAGAVFYLTFPRFEPVE